MTYNSNLQSSKVTFRINGFGFEMGTKRKSSILSLRYNTYDHLSEFINGFINFDLKQPREEKRVRIEPRLFFFNHRRFVVDNLNDADVTRVKAFCRFDLTEMDLIYRDSFCGLINREHERFVTSTLPPYLLKSRSGFPSSSDCGRTIVPALLARGNYLAVVRANPSRISNGLLRKLRD